MQKMLAVDAFLTVTTWLPYRIYDSLVVSLYDNPYRNETLDIVYSVLTLLKLTNAFTTPVVYFIFNKYFRVSICVC